MKKSWIIVLIAAGLVFSGIYQMASNKAAIAKELDARKRVEVVVPVTIAEIKKNPVSQSFTIDGVLSAKDQVTVLSETNGQTQAVYHDVGDVVDVGTQLAKVDAHVLNTQLEMARYSLANSERDLARFQNLLKANATTQQNVDKLLLSVESSRASVVALEKQVSNTVVRSPIRGVITARMIENGSVIGGGSPTFTIANLSEMTVKIGLTETEISRIKVGSEARVDVEALGKSFPGKVNTIGITADQSGRYAAELQLRGFKKGELRPDLSATVSFDIPAMDNLPVIPRKALVAGIKDPKIFVISNNKAMIRKITPALISGNSIVVAEGIQEGEKVVITGQMNLVDGTAVKVIR